MEDFIDVVNDLESKNEELAQLKAFQEVQATELTQVRKDFHELERDSKATLEKSEYKGKRDLHAANTKVFMFGIFSFRFSYSIDYACIEFLSFSLTQNSWWPVSKIVFSCICSSLKIYNLK